MDAALAAGRSVATKTGCGKRTGVKLKHAQPLYSVLINHVRLYKSVCVEMWNSVTSVIHRASNA